MFNIVLLVVYTSKKALLHGNIALYPIALSQPTVIGTLLYDNDDVSCQPPYLVDELWYQLLQYSHIYRPLNNLNYRGIIMV